MFLFFTIDILADYFPQPDNWEISTPEEEGINSEKVNKLMDLSFSDDSTSAVVVIKNGKIIGEKYADGYGKSSHGTSWSMAKSYYAALIGISLDKGEIESLDENVSNYLDYFADERSKHEINLFHIICWHLAAGSQSVFAVCTLQTRCVEMSKNT